MTVLYWAIAPAHTIGLGVADLVADVRTTSSVPLPSGAFRLASGQVFGGFIGA
jgi:hypothetical protein